MSNPRVQRIYWLGFVTPLVVFTTTYIPVWWFIVLTFLPDNTNMGHAGFVWLLLISPWLAWVSKFLFGAMRDPKCASIIYAVSLVMLYIIVSVLVVSGFIFSSATDSI